MDKKYVWVDTDLDYSDTFALISAFNLDNIEIVGISTVFGRSNVELNYNNAKNLLHELNKDSVTLIKGVDKPLIVTNYFEEKPFIIKGKKYTDNNDDVSDVLYKKAKELNGELYIVSIAALTNIAKTIYKYPDITKYIKGIIFGGGSISKGGNYTITSEKNVFFDPHAAQSVLKSGIPIVMLGLDIMFESYLTKNEIKEINISNDKIKKIINECILLMNKDSNKLSFTDKTLLFELCPLLYLNNVNAFDGKMAGVYVETQSPLSMGRTVSDVFVHADELFKNKNALVILECNRDLLVKDVIKSFNKY